jgi:hypothetical protein
MCVLCGEFIMQIHWTDYKTADSDEVVVGELQRDRKRMRMHRTKLCNLVLQPYNLKLEEWNNSKYILRDKKGRTVVIHDLGSMWRMAEKIIGKPIDPLSQELLSRLKQNTG